MRHIHIQETELKKIAFVPGAFRPFGDHHMKLVKHYADMCDEVVVVVSSPQEDKRTTSNGSSITPSDAKSIIDLCLDDYQLGNVTSMVSTDDNPIKTILRNIAKLKDCSVVLGVSSKEDDISRYDSIDLDYFKNNQVSIEPPRDTAFAPIENDGTVASASVIRDHISDKDMLKTYLPLSIEDDTFGKIYDILNGKSKNNMETHDELAVGSSIFQNLLQESIESDDVDLDMEYLDEEATEFSDIEMDDSTLESAKCSIIAYNTHILEGDDEGVYNPKNNPDKAIDILFELDDGNKIELFLDTKTKEWDSRVNDTSKLTPDQMGAFFSTDFCKRLDEKIFEMWPNTDPFFQELLLAVKNKKINCEPCGVMTEDGEFRKGNIDKERSREKNAAGEQIYTNSGRKIVSFSDFGVRHTDEEAYYCWPEKNKIFKWSQWADWKKIHVLCRCRFQHNSYLYGCSLSLFSEDNENRGFRSYNLDLEPKLQYCTPIETSQILDLNLVQRFLRNCMKRLNKLMSMKDEEIYEKVNAPDKCTLDDIRKTKHIIKNTMKAIRERRADTYIYTK